ncbi:hypothetical protein A4G20_06835 [Pasteurellaceae bacterium RH1A]|nr:hypothetical protein A4G20_06835 [Pasteurellaceae bacterium RH1A]
MLENQSKSAYSALNFMEILNMLTIPSQQLKKNFSEFANIAKSSEPIVITQYNRPTLVLSSYQDTMELMRLAAKMRFIERLDKQARYATEPTDQEMEALNRLIEEERELVYQENLKKNAK